MFAWNVVNVMARASQQNAPCTTNRRAPIETAEVWRTSHEVERSGEFFEEEIWRCTAVRAPPVVDDADLGVGFGCSSDRQAHRRWRNSSRIAVDERRRPASAEVQDADSASCSARRSASVRSSPSSSATRSRTVPSGSVVGSFRTTRPFSTRARSGAMALLYGDPSAPASTQGPIFAFAHGEPVRQGARSRAWQASMHVPIVQRPRRRPI